MMKKYINKSVLIQVLFALTIIVCNACKKDEPAAKILETGTMTDVEGNSYRTVKIGNQWWMSENLKVNKFRNGMPLPKVESNELWKEKKSSACNYNNSATAGILYNYYAIEDSNKIAPAGWHIPSDEEWKQLEKELGMSNTDVEKINWRGNNEGEKLKKEGFQYWRSSADVWATNESGFSAISDGCRMFSGEFSNPNGPGFMGFWWTSSNNGDEAWYRHLDYKNANVFRFYGPKNYGFSIRCVKD